MSDDLFAAPSKPRSSRLTLVLLLALVVSAAANYWLWQERQRAIADGKSAIARLAAAEATARDVTQRIQEMQGESIALAEKTPAPTRDGGAAIPAVDAGKKPEPDAEIAKAPAAKPEPEAKVAAPDAEDEGKAEAKTEPEKQATKPAKVTKRAKATKATKSAKAKKSAKATKPTPPQTKPTPPHKKTGTKPESASPDREL